MNILTLIPRRRRLEYAVYSGDTPVLNDAAESSGYHADAGWPNTALDRIASDVARAEAASLDAVAIRVPFGGPHMPGPVLADAASLEKLEAVVPWAPLHLPAAIRLTQGCGEVFGSVPVVLVFETSFFLDLPEREYSYGLAPESTPSLELRRYGFHGLYHDAACYHMARLARGAGDTRPQRVLSIVLERKPEVSAVIGGRPVTVTSGVTPLEGLPGETSSGDLDPGIVLALSRENGWGPEALNAALSRESGLLGLTGRSITFAELFHNEGLDDDDLESARKLVQYRLLLACGAGVAAMSGLDGIVFSGRYARLADRLGPWLLARLPHRGDSSRAVAWECFHTPLGQLVADSAVAALPNVEMAQAV